MSLAESSAEMWTEMKNKPTWMLGQRCFITIRIWLSVYMCIYKPTRQWGARVRSEETHALLPARKNIQHMCTHTHTHTHLWIQPSTTQSAREVEWGVCVCSFRRALYPGPCQLVVLRDLCTTKLIHSHSRRRAALAAMRRRSAEEAQSSLLWPFSHKYPLKSETPVQYGQKYFI